MKQIPARNPVAALALVMATCATACHTAHLSGAEGFGPQPVLPAPDTTLLPTVNVAPAVGWAQEQQPQVA